MVLAAPCELTFALLDLPVLTAVLVRMLVPSSIFGDTVNTASRMASTAPPAPDSPDASNPAFYIHLHSSTADQVRARESACGRRAEPYLRRSGLHACCWFRALAPSSCSPSHLPSQLERHPRLQRRVYPSPYGIPGCTTRAPPCNAHR